MQAPALAADRKNPQGSSLGFTWKIRDTSIGTEYAISIHVEYNLPVSYLSNPLPQMLLYKQFKIFTPYLELRQAACPLSKYVAPKRSDNIASLAVGHGRPPK